MTKIKIYTSTTCGFCNEQKEWLTQKSISFTEKPVEVEENSRELLERKVLGVPFTIIEFEGSQKEYTVTGFDISKLENLLLGSNYGSI